MRPEAGTRNGPKNDKFDEVWPPRRKLEPEIDLKNDKFDEVQNGPKNDK